MPLIGPALAWSGRVRFALGDFAFNLYWQSVSLYLLFYYTETLGLAIGTAAFVLFAGSIWDGIVDVSVGVLADRLRVWGGRYRPYLILVSAPLGLAFVGLYVPLAARSGMLIAAVLVAHLVFRTLYALANVPYSALTARVTQDSRERASIAGLRMLFGSLAAVVVALAAEPRARTVLEPLDRAGGFLALAVVFAVVGTAILLPLGLALKEQIPAAITPGSVRAFARDCWRGFAGNRAFVVLIAAMACMIVAATVLNKVTLYYFKYYLADDAAGRRALTVVAVVGGAAIPGWMLLGRWLGGRHVWLASAAVGLGAIAAFALVDRHDARSTMVLLGAAQAAIVGMNYAFWSLLPDTIEYGERATGVRMDATTFGLAALTQKFALGLGVGLFGLLFGWIGYRANVAQTPATLAGMRSILLVVPASALLLSGGLMLLNPLRWNTHARVLADLAARRAATGA